VAKEKEKTCLAEAKLKKEKEEKVAEEKMKTCLAEAKFEKEKEKLKRSLANYVIRRRLRSIERCVVMFLALGIILASEALTSPTKTTGPFQGHHKRREISLNLLAGVGMEEDKI
jgi:hypothetical protein